MDKILTDLAMDSLYNYFTRLSQVGYKSYNEVYRLLALIFTEELMLGNLSLYITEKDYTDLRKFLNCLYCSTCMIKLPDWQSSPYVNTNIDYNVRITEYDVNRVTEQEELRMKA